ncbi:Cacna1g [Symbiodinium pilosum]|uniref:Cacna1g protein n=1 Tax=Symbiodinium pilosum TaxID=2952 RepID=A0A812S978_SYMPI|nr:Cacna1g [Symbiodinium pilosum]
MKPTARVASPEPEAASVAVAPPEDAPPKCASPQSHNKSYIEQKIGAWVSFHTLHSDGMSTNMEDPFPAVSWQWEHRSGWRDYPRKVSTKIELAYRAGETKTRVQTGKKGSVPMEIFFEDMLQHDPISGNTRNVNRKGSFSTRQKVTRFLGGVVRMLETGKPRKERFHDYQQRRKRHVDPDAHQEPVKESPYHNGCCGLCASSPVFFSCTMCMVILYCLWLGVEADLNTNKSHNLYEAEPVFPVVENIFCVFFTLELIIRFCGFRRKRNCFQDMWFLFDLILMLLMVAELWIVPILLVFVPELSRVIQELTFLRALRLVRMARLTSLLRAFPEAMMLLKGISAAMRGVVTTMCLLLVILFMCALIFMFIVQGQDTDGARNMRDQYFSSVSHSMRSLFMHATLLDGPAVVYDEIEDTLGNWMAYLFLGCIVLSAFTVLNMLIGILCEVINKVSEAEKEEAQIRYLRRHLQDIFECYDVNQDKSIGEKEFALLLQNLEFREILSKFGTDVQDLQDIMAAVYNERAGTSVEFNELIGVVLRLKGGNNAQVTDIVDLRKFVKQVSDKLDCLLDPTKVPRGPPQPGVESIEVHIVKARGLRNADIVPLTGRSDVYCKCVVLGKPDTGVVTKVIHDTTNPVWNEAFVLADYQAGEHLRFQLFDQDWRIIKEDDYLGSTVLESHRFCPQGFEGELRLFGCGKGIEAYLEVKVKVKMLPVEDKRSTLSGTSVSSETSAGTSNMALLLARLDDIYAGQRRLSSSLKRMEERLDVVEVAVTRTTPTPDLRLFQP